MARYKKSQNKCIDYIFPQLKYIKDKNVDEKIKDMLQESVGEVDEFSISDLV